MSDWTTKDGRTNSSDAFVNLCDRVTEILANSVTTLETGEFNTIARFIMGQLAHVHGLVPQGAEPSTDPITLELSVRLKHIREILEAIGNGMPGANSDDLRLAAQDAMSWLADRECEWTKEMVDVGFARPPTSQDN